MKEWIVRIVLTPEQRDRLLDEAGKEVESLRVEVLEDRAAPKVFGISGSLGESDLRIIPE